MIDSGECHVDTSDESLAPGSGSLSRSQTLSNLVPMYILGQQGICTETDNKGREQRSRVTASSGGQFLTSLVLFFTAGFLKR